MRIGRIIVKKLRKGYKKISSAKRPPAPSLQEALTQMLTQQAVQVSGGEVTAKIAEQPVEVAARKPLPMEPKGPMEVTGALEMRRPRPELVTGGIELPMITHRVKIEKLKLEERKPAVATTYPLIPRKPAKDEPVFAYAKIFWDDKQNKYVYQVVEPEVSEKLKGILNKIKELLEQKLDVDLSKLKMVEASEYLNKQIEDIINYFGFKIAPEERKIIRYFIERDFMGLGRIEPLMHDPNIEDVSCDGVGIPLFVFHRDPSFGSMPTNIVFDDSGELDSFITRLVQLSGKSISVAQPLVDSTLPDGSRLQATLATDIARRGSNFTIRKFAEEPLTPIHLLNFGTIDVKSLAYLWLAVDFGRSILVSGGTASGKTSFLNVLSLFIRPDKKIISIEDTAELKLPHPHWVPTVARTPISVEGIKTGEVDMFDLLKESLRQRPDYIIVGEVRGKEAYILFQQIATGHPSLATIHAENMPKLVDRLTTQPISLPQTLIGSLDLVVFLLRARYKDKFVRRASEIIEMVKFDPDAKEPVINQVFKWNPINDTFEIVNRSILLRKISDVTGVSPEELVEELERRALVLNWMREKNITDYQSVHKVIQMYYTTPYQVLAAAMG